MKKIIPIIAVIALAIPLVILAQSTQKKGQTDEIVGQGSTVVEGVGNQVGQIAEVTGQPELISAPGNQAGNQNQVQNQNQEQNQVQANNVGELKAMIQARQQEANEEVEGKKDKVKSVYQNQNQVRVAVQALLASEDLVGGIGLQISAIAREFNNSIDKTIQAEEKIQTRNAFSRFFMGGDNESAKEIKDEAQQNQNRVQELKQLIDSCQCQAEVKAVIQEQAQIMEQEQERLRLIAEDEGNKKGLFGWMFGWLK